MSTVGRSAALRAAIVVLTAAPIVAASAVSAPHSAAAPMAAPPTVGDCYDLPAAAITESAGWLDAVAVPCDEPHTFQATRVGPAPADLDDDDPTAFAAQQCGPLGVWNELGVNRPRAGVVTDPLRIEARSFAVREPTPTYVCGAVAVDWSRRGDLRVLPLSSAIEDLTVAEREELRYCSRARGVRRPWTQPATVRCTVEPRWEVTSWVLWTAFYDENPGREILRERAVEICGADARFSLPRARDWTQGLPWTRCFTKRS